MLGLVFERRKVLKMARGKKIQITDDMSWSDRVVLFFGELGGTAILLFIGCMGCVSGITKSGVVPHEQISWTFGLAVMMAVQVFGHISGAHINPIVTLAAFVLGNISVVQVFIYFFGQLFGALTGFALLKAVTPSNYILPDNSTHIIPGVCSPGVNPNISPFQGFLVEFLITGILSWVCCAVWDSRNSDKHDSVTIRFGFTIAVLAMAAGPYTGANMNPVRSLAPALFNGDWDNHWVYWLGPLLGSFVAALIYRLLFSKDPPAKEEPEALPLNERNNKA